ncbi:Iron-uptake system permease protein FeuB [compost metagenome]
MICIPFGVAGLLLAFGISKSVTVTSLGEEMAVSLGQKTKWVKALSLLSVIYLTGTAVALVGKIAFVGLVIPHITRFIVGVDYRSIIPCSAVVGAVFLAFCDIISRYINFPFETPIGVVTAIVGIPFFLYLIRTKGGEQRG